VCEFIGWCGLFSAEWIGAIGSAVGGIGAGVAAWLTLRIAKSVRETEMRRRKAEATTLLRLITPEATVLPMKLHRAAADLEVTRSWWGDVFAREFSDLPKLLRTTLDRLAENPMSHATGAADRLSVLDDVGHGSIANDLATMIAYVSGVMDGAQKAKVDLEREAGDIEDTLEKLLRMVTFARDLSAQLAREMQESIGMQPIDYKAKFD